MGSRTATTDTAGFTAAVQRMQQEQPPPHFVVFTSSNNPGTSVPWCPDCVRTIPAVKRAAEELGVALLEVAVGGRGEWRNSSHPFRRDPELQLSGVPTLVHWGADGPGAALGSRLEGAASPQVAFALALEFMSQAKAKVAQAQARAEAAQ